ncbi:hypothetical protein LMIY3S_01031 [Labrys miyagiensis]
MLMPLNPGWEDIGLRLLATFLAAGFIGLNREARGHAAGLRTTMLVALAAALAMIQANILLPTSGKADGGFSSMDVMRLPLGILTGVGFIGGGAILKHGASISGITTAATLWIVTAIGLCFGGGQYALGAVGTLLALAVLWGMSRMDTLIPREYRAILVIAMPAGTLPPDLSGTVSALGCEARFRELRRSAEGGMEASFEIRWKQREDSPPALGLLTTVGADYPVRSFHIVSPASH